MAFQAPDTTGATARSLQRDVLSPLGEGGAGLGAGAQRRLERQWGPESSRALWQPGRDTWAGTRALSEQKSEFG